MIEIEHVTKRYGETEVVSNVSLIIQPRTIATIVGTSGSGKTTLLRMINRLVEPTSGVIKLDGVDNREVPGYALRRSIGYVIQGHGLFPHRTVAENIATVPILLGWDKERTMARVSELLTLFQLDPHDFGPRYPHELSGGQQQRVGVARALAAEPNVLLMDEPFGALDPIIRAKAQDDLLAIQKHFGTTIILVTHDMEEAIHLGHKIAVMDAGKVVQYATPAQILAKPATAFVEELVGTGDRPFKLLSLSLVGDAVEPGSADGEAIPATASQRDAFAALLWSGQPALPVMKPDGTKLGKVTVEGLMKRAARPDDAVRRVTAQTGGFGAAGRLHHRAAMVRGSIQAAHGKQRTGDLQSGQPAVADALPSAHRRHCDAGRYDPGDGACHPGDASVRHRVPAPIPQSGEYRTDLPAGRRAGAGRAGGRLWREADADRAVPLRSPADFREYADRSHHPARTGDGGGQGRRHDRLAALDRNRAAARLSRHSCRHPAFGSHQPRHGDDRFDRRRQRRWAK